MVHTCGYFESLRRYRKSCCFSTITSQIYSHEKRRKQKTFAYFEGIPYLKVDEYSSPAYIFKRFDTEVKKKY